MTLFFLFSFLTGCSLSQETFQAESIDVICALLIECYADEAVEFFEFESQDDCILALQDRLEPTVDCVYDPEKAQICLNEKRDDTCESFSFDDPSDACDEALICEEEDGEDSEGGEDEGSGN